MTILVLLAVYAFVLWLLVAPFQEVATKG